MKYSKVEMVPCQGIQLRVTLDSADSHNLANLQHSVWYGEETFGVKFP